ncbi:A disintegrin and metalloproteinase with thrombospondin motifs 7 [Saguinus oedipus]|uniref:A disintegrin and metalloproteinase with thrombospondin motifs 7 n=1 Tax=Saguinus oedipus TaxID=9490 RepID=A0ABQ9TAJ0_SAGOE|nr:A disintegrin and metalloproteinase with thrombospondin motifs 7 [Saguinus oedipus]
MFVDDFYYDYNFINFHEDLSYGPFEEPDQDLVGTGDGMPAPRGHPAVPSMGSLVPATEPPAATEEGALGPWSPSPWPSQASHSPPPPSELTPENSLVSFLPEEDAPIGAPDLGLPSLPWPRVSPDDVQMSATSGSQNDLVGEDSQRQLPPPWWDRTNEVSEDDEEPGGHRVPHLPLRPSPMLPPLSPVGSTHSSPGPDVVELWTGGTVAWEPVLEGGLGPGDSKLRPTVEVAPPPPPPISPPPEMEGRDSPLQLGTSNSPTPGQGSWDLQPVAVWGTFLPMTLTGLGHTPEPEPAPSPGPKGQPESLKPEVPLSSGLLSMPACDSPANSHRGPETQLLAPSLAEVGPPVDPLAARNASWQAGDWSEASGAGRVGGDFAWGCLRNINQCGHEAWPESSRPCGIEDCEPIQPSRESPNPWLSAKVRWGGEGNGEWDCQTIKAMALAGSICSLGSGAMWSLRILRPQDAILEPGLCWELARGSQPHDTLLTDVWPQGRRGRGPGP